MKLESIQIIGMHNIQEKCIKFDDGFTYITGTNGKGKSTILQAIQLALLGYIPGTQKKSAKIFGHSNGPKMSVLLTLSENGQPITFYRQWEKKGSKVEYSEVITPPGYTPENILQGVEIPIYDFQEWLGSTANEMKKWFLEFLPKVDTNIQWKSRMLEVIKTIPVQDDDDRVYEFIHQIESDPSLSNDPAAVNAVIKDNIKFVRSEISRNTELIESFALESKTSRSTEEVREELNNKINLLSSLQKDVADSEYNERILSEIQSLGCKNNIEEDERFKTLKDEINSYKLTHVKLNSEMRKTKERSDNLRKQLEEININIASVQTIVTGGGICPYSKIACKSIEDMFNQASSDYEQFKSQKKEIEEKIKIEDANYAGMQNDIETVRSATYSRNRAFDDIVNKYRHAESLKNSLNEQPFIDKDYCKMTIEELNKQIPGLHDELSDAASNESKDGMLKRATRDKMKDEIWLSILKSWETLTGPNKMQAEVAELPFSYITEALSRRVSQLFNKEIEAKFNLSDKSGSFSFGVVRDGDYIEYNQLSSGEKCMFALALMIEILKASPSSLQLLLVDDMIDHLDNENVLHFVESLSKVEGIQIVLAGVKDVRCLGVNQITL